MLITGWILLTLGALVMAITAVGLLRFPDLLTRMHVATKPQVLGMVLMLGGLGFVLGESRVAWTLLLVVFIMLIASPVAAHMVGRGGLRTQQVRADLMEVNELQEDLDRAAARNEE